MMKILLPVVFLVLGLGAGIGAGAFLMPEKVPQAVSEDKEAKEKSDKGDKADKNDKKEASKKPSKDDEPGGFEYLKLPKQFVVPVVKDDQITAMVTMSLSIEADPAITETFYAIEPKLRDRFLQVLFDHANTGGFDGIFTESDNLTVLRKALLEVARKDLGSDVSQVLIMSVNRQDS